jgi:hypothetical protein
MTGKTNERSPLAGLVLFMISLAILGSIIAGAHYYTVDLPDQQKVVQAPENSQTNALSQKCITCKNNCNYLPESEKYPCLENCELIC